MDHPGQLEIRRGEFLRRHLSQSEPPLGRSDRHRAEFGQRRHFRATRQRISGRKARLGQLPQRAWRPQRVDAARPALCRNLSGQQDRRRLFPPLLSRANAAARRQGAAVAVHRHDLFEYLVSRPPAARLCVWHPVSATQTEIWRFFLVDRDAPAEVKDLLRRYYMRYAGPAGMTEQDDMENWNYATAASRGTIARRYPYNYQASLGRARDNDPVPGHVSTQVTEENARGFYRSWQRYLDGADWPALIGRPAPQEPRKAAE